MFLRRRPPPARRPAATARLALPTRLSHIPLSFTSLKTLTTQSLLFPPQNPTKHKNTRAQGVVELIADHVVCREGQVLSPAQAALLRMFGVKMAAFHFKLLAAWHSEGALLRPAAAAAAAGVGGCGSGGFWEGGCWRPPPALAAAACCWCCVARREGRR